MYSHVAACENDITFIIILTLKPFFQEKLHNIYKSVDIHTNKLYSKTSWKIYSAKDWQIYDYRDRAEFHTENTVVKLGYQMTIK